MIITIIADDIRSVLTTLLRTDPQFSSSLQMVDRDAVQVASSPSPITAGNSWRNILPP